MTDPYAYGIDPPDEQYYRNVIQREKQLRQIGQTEGIDQRGVQAVMILHPPLRFEPGKCVRLFRDAAYPYCYELSLAGYAGFGLFPGFRFRIQASRGEVEEFSVSRTASLAQFHNAFPAYWRRKTKITGGQFGVEDGVVDTGRFFIGFSELPLLFTTALTREPTQEELDLQSGFDEFGNRLPPLTDRQGFTFVDDRRIVARLRENRLLCDDVPLDLETLVDTSIPSPIAAGALAYAVPVFGVGFSTLSVEPRVFQNIEGPFEVDETKNPFLIFPTNDPFTSEESE